MEFWNVLAFSFCILLFFLAGYSESQVNFGPELKLLCPSLMNKVWSSHVPKGGENAGVFTEYKPSTGDSSSRPTLQDCVEFCCIDPVCNVVFMHNSTCFKIECESEESCEPVLRSEPKFHYDSMILVRPSVESMQGLDVPPDLTSESDERVVSGGRSCERRLSDSDDPRSQRQQQECGVNEECVPAVPGADTLQYICSCRPGFQRSSDNICLPMRNGGDNSKDRKLTFTLTSSLGPTSPKSVEGETVEEGETAEQSAASPVAIKELIVSVSSKQVRLPEDEVTLSVYTVPPETPENPYNYKWELIAQPVGSTDRTVVEKKGPNLNLKHLTQGLYTFRVSVSGTGLYGESTANLSVLPQKRENLPPEAVVLPPVQIVKLPNSLAVLDASFSRDDAGIVKYHWELQQGPLGYQPNLTDTQTLQLKDLRKPGNYTFRLTVTDTDGASNSRTGNVTVLEAPDYPPEANAGPSLVLYLPRNNVTLNGSLSTDDRGIASWEWTKSPGDQDKAVDMQNTHTPYLQLSHLEEGMYTFVLKVTDDAGQSSSSDVHVFVKPPTNKPPTANAGANQTITLPQTWVTLNGSQSSDDIGITKWQWEQLSGPKKAVFAGGGNTSVTNVTELTKGEYVFRLTVFDENENTASSNVSLVVTQNANARPVANAGGDKSYSLPLSVLAVNGSGSSDDFRIAKWKWTREPTSLALGTFIDQTDTSPLLMVTNVVAGRYEFRLRVTDDQGEFDEDTVSIIVKPDIFEILDVDFEVAVKINDPELKSLVELTLNIEASKMSASQMESVLVKLGMLLRDSSQLVLRELRQDHAGRATLHFYVLSSSSGSSVSGPQVVRTLRDKLYQDSFLLQITVVSIRTTICQNNCSGHGVCDQETRECFCEAFWMEDLYQKYLGDGESNCGWSILYVGIALLSLLLLAMSALWGLVFLCSRLCRPSTSDSNPRYALLGSTEQVRLPMSKVNVSESDTDSDVLFETRRGGTGDNSSGRANGLKKNGLRSQRRIKA